MPRLPLAASFNGIDGFLGTRASLMLDIVFLAMFAIVPVMIASVAMVRYRHLHALHKRLQLALGIVLLVAVTAFEIDIRLHGWRDRAEPSPHYPGAVNVSLGVHLAFAVPTAVLWVIVIVRALRRFPKPAAPSGHSPWHRRWGRWAAFGMFMTAVTGWVFYWLAFAA